MRNIISSFPIPCPLSLYFLLLFPSSLSYFLILSCPYHKPTLYQRLLTDTSSILSCTFSNVTAPVNLKYITISKYPLSPPYPYPTLRTLTVPYRTLSCLYRQSALSCYPLCSTFWRSLSTRKGSFNWDIPLRSTIPHLPILI